MSVWLVAQHVNMRELEDWTEPYFFIGRHCMSTAVKIDPCILFDQNTFQTC